MRYKTGVEIVGLIPEMSLVLQAVEGAYEEVTGLEPTCTSGTERTSKHKRSSKHYCGAAMDFRIKDSTGVLFPSSMLSNLQQALGVRLTAEFDVVLEADHFHIEYDVKGI